MNDAISRSAAIQILTEWPKRLGIVDPGNSELYAERVGCLETLAAVRHEIDRIPALDVAPVVHAKWIMNHFGAKCSNCLRLYCVEPSWSEKIKHMPPTWIYCPNCGAKMDGEIDA